MSPVARFPRLDRNDAGLAPVPELDEPGAGGVFEESTAVAHYDAVTTRVAIADIAPLVAAAQPTSMVEALRRPAAMATGSVVSHPAVAAAVPALAPSRRRRTGLAIFVALTTAAVWAVAACELWFLVLR